MAVLLSVLRTALAGEHRFAALAGYCDTVQRHGVRPEQRTRTLYWLYEVRAASVPLFACIFSPSRSRFGGRRHGIPGHRINAAHIRVSLRAPTHIARFCRTQLVVPIHDGYGSAAVDFWA